MCTQEFTMRGKLNTIRRRRKQKANNEASDNNKTVPPHRLDDSPLQTEARKFSLEDVGQGILDGVIACPRIPISGDLFRLQRIIKENFHKYLGPRGNEGGDSHEAVSPRPRKML